MQQQRRHSRFILGILFLGLLAVGALTASPAQAVDAVGPYYAEPSWDQSLPAATRFVVLTNWASKAVLDKETGLVWGRSPQVAASATWNDARVACANKTVGNRKGWRLPSLHELQSLIDPAQGNPALPLDHPFVNVQPELYWSASTDAADPTLAWVVYLPTGDEGRNPKSNSSQVWCVRGGMNADQH